MVVTWPHQMWSPSQSHNATQPVTSMTPYHTESHTAADGGCVTTYRTPSSNHRVTHAHSLLFGGLPRPTSTVTGSGHRVTHKDKGHAQDPLMHIHRCCTASWSGMVTHSHSQAVPLPQLQHRSLSHTIPESSHRQPCRQSPVWPRGHNSRHTWAGWVTWPHSQTCP